MTQVQLRIAEQTVKGIDKWVEEGRFKSRSDAIKTIIAIYEEKDKMKEFYKMLLERSEEARKYPEKLIRFE